jgi:membrane associated rhomboid family serine protease
MSAAAASVEVAGEQPPDGLLPVGEYASFAEGSEHGLVILAMGWPYWLIPTEHRFVLLVERGAELAAGDQLARFDRESVGWPPPPPEPLIARRRVPLFTPLLWALGLLAAFRAQQRWPAATELGSLDASALFERGEWWRPGTALFLHGDVGHLVSNLISGVFVCSAVLATFGNRLGWTLLALASFSGNLASAALRHGTPYHSVGASTAVFAGLGLLTGRALPLSRPVRGFQPWRGLIVPLGAGLTLLALYGAGGQRVDFGAHLCGFAAGLLGGVVAGLGSAPRAAGRTAPDQDR